MFIEKNVRRYMQKAFGINSWNVHSLFIMTNDVQNRFQIQKRKNTNGALSAKQTKALCQIKK